MVKTLKKIAALAGAVVLSATMLSGCAKEKASDTLVFGTNAEFPPFEFVSSNGLIDQYDGIDIAVAKKIGDDNGMAVKIENMEFDSLLIAGRPSRASVTA